MKLLIQGNNIAVTEAIDEYVHQKLEKAVKHFENMTSKVDVHLSVGKNARMNDKHKAEVTVYASGAVIHQHQQHRQVVFNFPHLQHQQALTTLHLHSHSEIQEINHYLAIHPNLVSLTSENKQQTMINH